MTPICRSMKATATAWSVRTMIVAIVVLSLFTVSSARGVDDARPRPLTYRLENAFDLVRFMPDGRSIVLANKTEGRVIVVDLSTLPAGGDASISRDNGIESDFDTGYPIDDIEIDQSGTLYAVGANALAAPSALRLTLGDGGKPRVQTRLLALPAARSVVAAYRLALMEDDRQVRLLVGRFGGPMTELIDAARFDDPKFPSELGELRFPLDDLISVPGFPLALGSASSGGDIYGIDPVTWKVETLALPGGGRVALPRAMAATWMTASGPVPADPTLAAVVADAVTGNLLVYDYSRLFNSLNLVTRAQIGTVEPESRVPSAAAAPLVVAVSKDLSSIMVGSRSSSRIDVFARDQRVLTEVNRFELGPIADLDLNEQGDRAAILGRGGKVLTLIERPGASTLSSRLGFSQETADVQRQLARFEVFFGSIDGIPGPETREALSRFQISQGLDPTGELDPATRAALSGAEQRQMNEEALRLRTFLAKQGFRNFEPSELVVQTKRGECVDRNWIPRGEAWCNIVGVTRILDALRSQLPKNPITVVSAYRSADLNACLDKERDDAFSNYSAAEFRARGRTPTQLAAMLKEMRSEGMFDGQVTVGPSSVSLELPTTSDLWVMAGTSSSEGEFSAPPWLPDSDVPPSAGDVLTSNPTAKPRLRATEPYWNGESWEFGEPIAYLTNDLGLVVNRVKSLKYPDGKTRYWAAGKVVFAGEDRQRSTDEHWFVHLMSSRDLGRLLGAADFMASTRGLSDFGIIDLGGGDYRLVGWLKPTNQADAKRRLLRLHCYNGDGEDVYMFPVRRWTEVDGPSPPNSKKPKRRYKSLKKD